MGRPLRQRDIYLPPPYSAGVAMHSREDQPQKCVSVGLSQSPLHRCVYGVTILVLVPSILPANDLELDVYEDCFEGNVV